MSAVASAILNAMSAFSTIGSQRSDNFPEGESSGCHSLSTIP
jgi:hypothetical protein